MISVGFGRQEPTSVFCPLCTQYHWLECILASTRCVEASILLDLQPVPLHFIFTRYGWLVWIWNLGITATPSNPARCQLRLRELCSSIAGLHHRIAGEMLHNSQRHCLYSLQQQRVRLLGLLCTSCFRFVCPAGEPVGKWETGSGYGGAHLSSAEYMYAVLFLEFALITTSVHDEPFLCSRPENHV